MYRYPEKTSKVCVRAKGWEKEGKVGDGDRTVKSGG